MKSGYHGYSGKIGFEEKFYYGNYVSSLDLELTDSTDSRLKNTNIFQESFQGVYGYGRAERQKAMSRAVEQETQAEEQLEAE